MANKKLLSSLFDSAGNEILINGELVVDPSSGVSLPGHMRAGNQHLPAAKDVGKVLISTANGGSQWGDKAALGLNDAVIGPSASLGNTVPVFDGKSGKALKDSGFTLKASVPEGAVFHSGIALMGNAADEPVFNGKLSLVLVEYNPD